MEAGYAGGAVAGAVLGTVFFPLFALIVALLLQSGQSDPAKRAQLRTWAWASGAWLVLEVVVSVVLALVTI
jgi:fumarate reductase subunit D